MGQRLSTPSTELWSGSPVLVSSEPEGTSKNKALLEMDDYILVCFDFVARLFIFDLRLGFATPPCSNPFNIYGTSFQPIYIYA